MTSRILGGWDLVHESKPTKTTVRIENALIIDFIRLFPLFQKKILSERLKCEQILVNNLLCLREIGEIVAKFEDIRTVTVYVKGPGFSRGGQRKGPR